jgi:hypothetical protein
MDRKRLMLAAVALIAALALYTVYDGSITHWDGYALEVEAVTEAQETAITLTAADLQSYPDIASVIEEAGNDGVSVIDEYAIILDFEDLMEKKGADTDAGYYFVEADDTSYLITPIAIGGVYSETIYMYLAGLMLLVSIGLAATGMRK